MQTGSACMFPAPIHCGREGDGHRGDPPTSALLPFRKDGQTDESLAEDDWRVDDAPRVVQALKEIPRRCQNPPAGSESPTGCASRRSEEHTSELQSLMRISYAVFCLKKKHKQQEHQEKLEKSTR